MKKCKALVLLLFLGFSSLGLAEDFKATVDRSAVGIDESFNLRLELSDLQPRSRPDFSEIEKSFQVLGQQQSSVTNVINGTSSSSIVWDLNLAPTQVGQTMIPSIAISTNRGDLKSQPVAIQVNQGVSPQASVSGEKGISFIAKASKTELYKNEPVVITFRLTSMRSLKNIQMGDLIIKDAIVESQGQPKLQTDIINGRQQMALMASYVITPLKDGVLTVPPLVVRGETLAPRTQSSSPHGGFNSFFGNDEDPFAGMQKMMESFAQDTDLFERLGRMKPISLNSKPIKINVLPPVTGIDPWLPTTNLKLVESWSSDQPRVGEPLTRTISTEAIGLAGSQLPGFEDQLKTNDDYKVYTDRPETTTKLSRGQIESQRKDIYTIVPQRAGDMRLPALKLIWWDTHNHLRKVASVPERIVRVLAGSSNFVPTATNNEKLKTDQLTLTASEQPVSKSYRWLIGYALFSAAITLFILLVREFLQMRKVKLATHITTEQKSAKTPGRVDLETCLTLGDIHRFLQIYSNFHWDAPANSSLSRIFSAANCKLINIDQARAKNLSKKIEEGLYANKSVNVKELQFEIVDLIFQKTRLAIESRKGELLPELNPS